MSSVCTSTSCTFNRCLKQCLDALGAAPKITDLLHNSLVPDRYWALGMLGSERMGWPSSMDWRLSSHYRLTKSI